MIWLSNKTARSYRIAPPNIEMLITVLYVSEDPFLSSELRKTSYSEVATSTAMASNAAENMK